MSIVFASGDQLRIKNKPIGVGGEGKVFQVANDDRKNIVAKIYNRFPDQERQRKLKLMVSMQEQSLLDASAWPKELLIDSKSGNICGFTMQEITDSEPLHHYYSPSWRKQNQPYSSWDSLLQLSANLAAIFSSVHSQGIIIGDVNPNSVRVRNNGRVVLIDTDSFQLNYQGEVFRCRVGVPSFTAPELLATSKSFDEVKRNFNHDLFGLSLLIFHMLFMGRHPFAGVYSGAGDTPIESHIQGYRYAYAIDHAQRGLIPPPLSIQPIAIASSTISAYFQNDFTQMGAVKGRTRAGEWFSALSSQRKRLRRCIANHSHVFDSSLTKCVWCELEMKGQIFFQSKPIHTRSSDSNSSRARHNADDLLPTKAEQAAWCRISSLSSQKYSMPVASSTMVAARYSLTGIEKRSILARSAIRMAALTGAMAMLLSAHYEALPFAIVMLVAGFSYMPKTISALLDKYKKDLVIVQSEVSTAMAHLQQLTSGDRLRQIMIDAESSWVTLKNLRSQYDKEISDKLVLSRKQHVDTFLSSYLIADASISGIGPGRSSTLASYGIETASDVSYGRINSISGFGPVLVSTLLSWKQGLLANYKAPSDIDLSKQNEAILLPKYLSTRSRMGARLQSCLESYDGFEQQLKVEIADYEHRVRSGFYSISAIQADIRQLGQSAARTFNGKYQFLIF